MTKDEALRMALEALETNNKAWKNLADSGDAGFWEAEEQPFYEIAVKAIIAIKKALAQPEQEPVAKKMTAHRAVYFMERFKHEEKLLGPNEQAALDFVISMLEAQQEPVAMKFKIYKPTVPDPTRQGINNALLPWVYDQDRSSGFDASMWVTPVATLPPQRTWVGLTEDEVESCFHHVDEAGIGLFDFADAIEAKLKEKNNG